MMPLETSRASAASTMGEVAASASMTFLSSVLVGTG